MSINENCKYYDMNTCTKYTHLICAKRKCNAYISKYTRTDCKHYDSKRGIVRCRILCDRSGGTPCAHPRIKNNGLPVSCTFFEARHDSK